MNKEVKEYCKDMVNQYLNGDMEQFEHFVKVARAIYESEELWQDCLYLKGKRRIKARVNFKTGEIKDLSGNVLRGEFV